MSTHWQGDLFFFIEGLGKQFVSAAAPIGSAVKILQHFKASGPAMPVNWPSATLIGDVEEWKAAKRQAGFSFRPAN